MLADKLDVRRFLAPFLELSQIHPFSHRSRTVIRELSDSEFHATFASPMRRLGADESFRPIPLGEYVSECIKHHALPTSREGIQIEHVYVAADQRHSHVMLHYGVPNLYLVIVVYHDTDSVFGHHFLNLNQKYGLTRTSGEA